MAYRHSHPPFHIPEAAPRTTNGNGGGGSGGLGPYPPYPQHQQQQQGLPPPPLPSPDYYSYLIQTPDGLGGQPTLGAAGGGGSAGGVGGEENRQQRAAWAAAAEARGGWDPSMFNTPPGESGGSEVRSSRCLKSPTGPGPACASPGARLAWTTTAETLTLSTPPPPAVQ